MTAAPTAAAPTVTGADIVRAARSFLGVGFRHCGRDRMGLDCAGLLVVVARELGLPVRDRVRYSRQECELHTERLREEIEATCDPVIGAWQPGDVLILRVGVHRVPQHLAIWTGEESIIHAAEIEQFGNPDGGVIEMPWRPAHARMVAGVYRWRGIG